MSIIRRIEDNGLAEQKIDSGLAKLLQKGIPKDIHKVLKEHADVFPEDLPPGLPSVRMGHEFRLDLEDNTPLVHRPLYKMSPL